MIFWNPRTSNFDISIFVVWGEDNFYEMLMVVSKISFKCWNEYFGCIHVCSVGWGRGLI